MELQTLWVWASRQDNDCANSEIKKTIVSEIFDRKTEKLNWYYTAITIFLFLGGIGILSKGMTVGNSNSIFEFRSHDISGTKISDRPVLLKSGQPECSPDVIACPPTSTLRSTNVDCHLIESEKFPIES